MGCCVTRSGFHLLLLLVLGWGAGCRPNPGPQAESLVLWLPFNGDYTDHGPRKFSVIGAGSFVDGHDGRREGALYLDGKGQYLVVTPDTALRPAGQMTVMAWLRYDDTIFPHVVFNNAFVVDAYSGLMFNVTPDGRVQVLAGNADHVGYNARTSYISQAPAVTPLEWVHVTWVYDSLRNMKIYINGEEVPGYYNGEGGYLAYAKGGVPTIGKYDASNERGVGEAYMQGAVDDLRIYNVVLPPETIRSLAKP